MAIRVSKQSKRKSRSPKFNMARGHSLVTTPPPFKFSRVTLEYFPLQANINALRDFCDSYLNIAPDHAYFKPSMPFVVMVVVNYPRMSVAEGNLGWTSSNELLFTIPVDWYERRRGEWVYKAPAQFAPYIFVNDEASQIEGREVYGWPKVQGWLTSGKNTWVKSPRDKRNVFNMTTNVFEELYANKSVKAEQFLSIAQDPPISVTEFPPKFSNPLNPLASLPNAMAEWGALTTDILQWAINGSRNGTFSAQDSLTNGISSIAHYLRTASGNTINLKQIRDALHPGFACYQALTNAAMKVKDVHGGGLLGDMAQLRGDLSGGYEIALAQYPSLPIVESLGLQVQPNEDPKAKVKTARLRPVMPFWQELDLEYLRGEDIAWRSVARRSQRWRGKRGEKSSTGKKSSNISKGIPYATTGSAGFQVAEGPFHFPNASFRVLPLLADKTVLAAYLEGSNARGELTKDAVFGQVPADLFFVEPLEPKVYMIIGTFGEMGSGHNNMGIWEDTQVRFCIPVLSYALDAEGNRLNVSTGLVTAFMYSNSELGSTTMRELNGWPCLLSEITSLPNTWAEPSGPFDARQPVMRVKTKMPAIVDTDQPYEWRTLLEVVEGSLIDWQDEDGWRYAAHSWGKKTKADLVRMHEFTSEHPQEFKEYQSLAMSLLVGGHQLNEFSFKQFREASDPRRACYQAVVSSQSTVKVKEIRELGHRTSVKIRMFPTQQIVETLGLIHHGPDPATKSPFYLLQAYRPFFLRADITTALGESIVSRAGTKKWLKPMRKMQPVRRVPGADFVDFINEGETCLNPNPFGESDNNPQKLKQKMDTWSKAASEELFVNNRRAAELMQEGIEPHMVIHRMLAKEWEHFGNPRWYQESQEFTRRARANLPPNNLPLPQQLPTFVVPTDVVGSQEDTLFPEEERVPNETEPQYWTPEKPMTRKADD